MYLLGVVKSDFSCELRLQHHRASDATPSSHLDAPVLTIKTTIVDQTLGRGGPPRSSVTYIAIGSDVYIIFEQATPCVSELIGANK